jgi:hypothetical protein
MLRKIEDRNRLDALPHLGLDDAFITNMHHVITSERQHRRWSAAQPPALGTGDYGPGRDPVTVSGSVDVIRSPLPFPRVASRSPAKDRSSSWLIELSSRVGQASLLYVRSGRLSASRTVCYASGQAVAGHQDVDSIHPAGKHARPDHKHVKAVNRMLPGPLMDVIRMVP